MQHCSVQLASIVWWRNEKIVKCSVQNQEKCECLLTKKEEQRSIERSGVWQQRNLFRCMTRWEKQQQV